jgi:hypothetical protein
MARTAKCRICGKQLSTNTAFKVDGKPAKYYCSEEEFRAEEERKKKAAEDKDRVYTLICRIIGRETIINTALWAEWKIWSSVADDVKIGQFLAENEEYLTNVIGRLANAEFPRIRYLSTVLKNRLGDYQPKAVEEVGVQPKAVTVDETMYDTTPTITRKRRRSLDELEEEI